MLREESRIFPFSVTNATYCTNGTWLSNALFQIPGLIKRQSGVVGVYVSLEAASFPSSWYVLNENNNVLAFDLSLQGNLAVTYTFVVTQLGTYDAYGLQDILNLYLADASITAFEFAYDISNNKMGAVWSNATPEGNTLEFLNSTTMAFLLGIDLDTIIDDDAPINDFTNQVNLTGVTNYIIQCDQLPVQNYSLQTRSNVLASIQNAASTWGITQWANISQIRFAVSVSTHVDQLNVKIYDQNGDLINFNGQPWDLVLKVTYVKTGYDKGNPDIMEAVKLLSKRKQTNPPSEHVQNQKNGENSIL